MRFSVSIVRFAMLIGLSTLAACSPIESRTRNGLIRAGLSPKLAACMAKPMAEQLSVAQLRRLAALGKSGDGADEGAGEGHGRKHLLRRIAALGDPQIISVTATAAALCSVGLRD